MPHICLAKLDLEIERCFPVLQELRPHLVKTDFVSQIRRQEQQYSYRLAYLEDSGDIKVIAGFRISECLACGRFLYVDDLVTKASDRSKGYGDIMFDWLVEQAKLHSCQQLNLDSGVQRFGAHRFYMKKQMEITSHHFSMKIY